MDVFNPVFRGLRGFLRPARFRYLEGPAFAASDGLKRPHVVLFFQLVFRTAVMGFPASATLGVRLRAYARSRAEKAAAPFAESSKQDARWFVQKAAGRVWVFRIRSRAATVDGKQKRIRKTHRRRRKAASFRCKFSKVTAPCKGDPRSKAPRIRDSRQVRLRAVASGSMQSRNTQSIKRSFVRWVYFALNRRGLDLSVFRRHVYFRLSQFSLFLVCSNRDVSRPCQYPPGKDHQR